MDKIDTTGHRIRERLDDLNMSQAELVKRTGINKATISQYLSDKYAPKHDRIEILAQALNADAIWLMGYDVPKMPYHKMEAHYIDTIKIPHIDKAAIAKEDQRLSNVLRLFDSLNDEGKEKLIEYAEDLVASGRYIKSDTTGMVQEEA